jgi:hypothetical protein
MAAMRGGSVKKIRSEETDDESSTVLIKRVGLTVMATVIHSLFFVLCSVSIAFLSVLW